MTEHLNTHSPPKSGRPRVLVVSPDPIPSFARQDAQLLSSSFEVDLVAVNGLSPVNRLRKSIGQADAVLIWFMGRNAVLPIMLARLKQIPIISVIGGFEVAWVEELNYGVRPGSFKESVLKRMMAASSRILSVSEFSQRSAIGRFPEFKSKCVLVRNAVDTSKFVLPMKRPREGVISVAAISSETVERKSLRLYVEAARRMTDVTFTLIGPTTDHSGAEFVRTAPPNLEWQGALDHNELARRLQAASVYVQASVYESFGVALAEAMSCGCFPVISDRAALPEVAGPTATIMKDLSTEAAVTAIRMALARPESERAEVRRRVVEQFGIEKRKTLLITTIEQAIASKAE